MCNLLCLISFYRKITTVLSYHPLSRQQPYYALMILIFRTWPLQSRWNTCFCFSNSRKYMTCTQVAGLSHQMRLINYVSNKIKNMEVKFAKKIFKKKKFPNSRLSRMHLLLISHELYSHTGTCVYLVNESLFSYIFTHYFNQSESINQSFSHKVSQQFIAIIQSVKIVFKSLLVLISWHVHLSKLK